MGLCLCVCMCMCRCVWLCVLCWVGIKLWWCVGPPILRLFGEDHQNIGVKKHIIWWSPVIVRLLRGAAVLIKKDHY